MRYCIKYLEWREGDSSIVEFSAESLFRLTWLKSKNRKEARTAFRKWKKKNKHKFNTKIEKWGRQKVINVSDGSWSHARLVEVRRRKSLKRVDKILLRA